MKKIYSLPLATLLFFGSAITALAQSQRYPTTQELQDILSKFRRERPNIQQSRSYQDRRSQTEKQQLAEFVKNWVSVDPAVAPFLGSWVAIEETTAIYPSRTRGRVCIIDSHSGGNQFTIGTIQNGYLLTEKNTILSRENTFLVSAFVYQGKPLYYQYANPSSLRHPSQSTYLNRDRQIINNFNKAGCMVELPSIAETTSAKIPTSSTQKLQNSNRQATTGNTSLASAQSIDNVTMRFDGAYINTSGTFKANLVIENLSNRPFGFVPLFAKVEDINGQSVKSRVSFNSSGNVVAEPSSTLKGEVFVLEKRWNQSGPQNLFLVIKEGTTGGRTFRVPLERDGSLISQSRNQQISLKQPLLSANSTPSISGLKVEPELKPRSLKDVGWIPSASVIIDRVNCKELSNKGQVCSFDLYNLGYADAVLEVYDARRNLMEVRGVDGVRNPSSVFSFPVESIERLYKISTEDFGIDDPRHAAGQRKNTEIKNIFIPQNGFIEIVKTGINAKAYNQATFLMGLFLDTELPGSLPGSLKSIFGENPTLKQSLLSALYVKLQQERIGSIAREGGFANPGQAFITGSWIDQGNLEKLMEIGVKTLAEEALKQGASRTLVNEAVLAKKLNFWVSFAEIFAKGGNAYLQWLDWERAQKMKP